MLKRMIVWTACGLSCLVLLFASGKLIGKLMRDRKYRRVLRKEGIRSRRSAKNITKAAVSAVLRHHYVLEKRPPTFLLRAELLSRLSGDTRNAEKMAKKREKLRNQMLKAKWKRRGAKYDPKTGLVRLVKAKKLPKLKRLKPYKLKRR